MNEKLVIRITDINAPAEWTVLDAHGNRMGFPQKGALEIAAPLSRQRKVIVVVSGPEVTAHQVTLPIKSRKQLLQAIPFALEDSLSEDIDNLHFAVGKSGDNKINTCVCRQNWLESLVIHVKESGINPDVITPDFQVIDPGLSRPVLLVDDKVVTYSDETHQWSLPVSLFNELAPAISRSLDPDTPVAEFFCSEAGAQHEVRVKAVFGYDGSGDETGKARNSLLPLFSAGAHANCGINLMQGRFRPTGTRHAGAGNWKVPAALAATWLILLSSNFLAERAQYGKQDRKLDEMIEQVFHAALPDTRTIVNPRAQFEQALGQRGDNSLGSDFLALLAVSSTAISNEPDTSFNSVSYSNGQIEVSVNASNVQSLDNIKRFLAERYGLNVDILSADTRDDNVVGQIRISEGS